MKNKKLIALIIISALFIINTILVVSDKFSFLDDFVRNVVFSFNGEVADKAMKMFTFMGSTPFIIGVALVVFTVLILRKKRNAGIAMAGTIIFSTIVNNVVKIIVRRQRPLYMSIVEKTLSYPSGHIMGATTMYGFIIYLLLKSSIDKKYKVWYGIFLVLLITLIGTSRIYLGAHFFTDILGGAYLSVIILLVFSMIDDKKKLI